VSKSTSAGSYFICGTPRTGSTLLCGLLRSTGIAGRPESYFRQPDQQAWANRWRIPRGSDGFFDYRDYLRAAIAEGSTDNGVFGARLMWGTLDEVVAKLGVAYPQLAGADLDLLTEAFGPLRFVHLRRNDIVAQAVSWARAEQTGYWQSGDTASREPSYHFAQIDQYVRTIEDHNAAWRSWFTAFNVRPYQLSYEQLTADLTRVTRNILTFLGLDLASNQSIAAGHQRQADQTNAAWISRYHATAGRQ
jgi:trehalose 2-sulfotransferase